MYKPEGKIEVEKELIAIQSYVSGKWVGVSPETLNKALESAFYKGLEATKLWFNIIPVTDVLKSIQEERKSMLKEDTLILYDAISYFGLLGGLNFYNLNDKVKEKWEFEKQARSMISDIRAENYDIIKVLPLGYKELKNQTNDIYNLINIYCEEQSIKDKTDFQGMEIVRDFPFPTSISVPHVLYSDVEQGRSPLTSLLSSAFSQGMSVSEHNNTVALVEDLNKLKEIWKSSEYLNEVLYELPGDTDNILLNIVLNDFKKVRASQFESEEKFRQTVGLKFFPTNNSVKHKLK